MEVEDAYLLPTYSRLPIALVKGEGSYVWDEEGNRFLDFYGGHCVTALGHCPPRVTEAIREQAGTLMFYSNVVYSPVRARAAQILGDLAPEGMDNIFFGNSGTEANETALKLARVATGRSEVVGITGGFHGRTLGSLAVTGIDRFREPYQSVLAPAHFVEFGDVEALRSLLKNNDDVAAVIVEPIQSMAGVQTAPDEYFHAVRKACDEAGCLLIFDEIQTGVGRTGAFTFADRVGVKPDIITLAKSLGSGVPVGAVLASDAIASTVKLGDHGTTFGGGMIAMAALIATLEELVEGGWMDRATVLFDRVKEGLSPHVIEVRGEGGLIGIELEGPSAPVVAALREKGILTGGSGHPNTIRLLPPLTVSDEEIDEFVSAFIDVVSSQAVSEDA